MRQALAWMAPRSTKPQKRESSELSRLSPMTKYLSGGTVTGPKLSRTGSMMLGCS